jgi:hypothetical protein
MIKRILWRTIDKSERELNYGTNSMRDMLGGDPRAACLLSRVIAVLAVAILVGGVALAAPAAAFAAVQPAAVTVYTMSPGRIAAIVAGLTGLTAAFIGGLALARSADRSGTLKARRRAVVALLLGPVGLVIGGLVVATADGGIGTGNGVGGGVVAMIVGLIGIALGWLALTRSHRTS